MSNPKELTEERNKQHGDWSMQSQLAHDLKETMRLGGYWSKLSAGQQEALDMIQTKVSRILVGDPTKEDHWDDIAGYAFLGSGRSK